VSFVLAARGELTAERIAEGVGAPYATVTKEIRRLQRAGIVEWRTEGRTKYVRAARGDVVVRAIRQALKASEPREGGAAMSKKKDKKKDDKKKKKK
jgi:sugar-specific transcriptional regulator TrmB